MVYPMYSMYIFITYLFLLTYFYMLHQAIVFTCTYFDIILSAEMVALRRNIQQKIAHDENRTAIFKNSFTLKKFFLIAEIYNKIAHDENRAPIFKHSFTLKKFFFVLKKCQMTILQYLVFIIKYTIHNLSLCSNDADVKSTFGFYVHN